MKLAIGGVASAFALAVALWPSSAAALTFGPSPGSLLYATEPHYAPSPGGVLGGLACGDFNDDGVADLAVVVESGVPAFSAGESVAVFLGHRDGIFTPAPGSPIGLFSGGIFASGGSLAATDLNGDGRLDLVVTDNYHQTVSVLLGAGDGRFVRTAQSASFSGEFPTDVVVGDFNGDHHPDVAFAAGTSLNVLLGDGGGGLAPAPASPVALGSYYRSATAADFNGDGRTDIALGQTTGGAVAVYLASGKGQLAPAAGSPIAVGGSTAYVSAGDVDGDGRADVVAASGGVGGGNVTVLLGDGHGGFAPTEASPIATPLARLFDPEPEGLVVADLDGDGHPDLAIANFFNDENIAVLLGDGHGGFANLPHVLRGGGNPRQLVAGDFNGDGALDLADTNPFWGTMSILQNGLPEAQAPTPPLHPEGPHGPPTGPTVPARAEVEALLRHELGASSPRRLRALATHRSFRIALRALEAGRLRITWSATTLRPRTAAGSRRTLVGAGAMTVARPGTARLTVRTTHSGRVLARHARRLRLQVTIAFRAEVGPAIVVSAAKLLGR